MLELFALLRRPKRTSGGYLLIKRWGAGFWSDVDMVVTQLLAAELMQRIPIVQWGMEGPYADGKTDSFNLYFEPVSKVSVFDLSGSIYPKNWTAANLTDELPFSRTGLIDKKYGIYHFATEKRFVRKSDRQFKFLRRRNEEVVVAYCWESPKKVIKKLASRQSSIRNLRTRMMRDRLILKPDLQKKIAAYHSKHLENHSVMAVHLRGSDKVFENPLLHIQNEKAFNLSQDWIRQDLQNLIFLATDSSEYAERWTSAFGADRVKLQDCLRSDGETPNFLRSGSNGYRNGCEIILDTYIAAGCERFVGNSSSNVARFVAAIGDFSMDRLHWLDR